MDSNGLSLFNKHVLDLGPILWVHPFLNLLFSQPLEVFVRAISTFDICLASKYAGFHEKRLLSCIYCRVTYRCNLLGLLLFLLFLRLWLLVRSIQS